MRFKLITILLIVCEINLVFSQISINEIPPLGSGINAFIPPKWIAIDSVKCDFNKDSLIDLALVIQAKNPIIQKNNKCGGSEEYYPKCLIICLKSKDGNYYLSLKSQTIFGNCNWGLQGGDPFTSIGKRKNSFKIEFFTGGTLRIIPTYYFRYQNSKWVLIGYNEERVEVPSNNSIVDDYNLVKGIKEKYRIENGKKSKIVTTRFTPPGQIDLKDFDATGGGYPGLKDPY